MGTKEKITLYDFSRDREFRGSYSFVEEAVALPVVDKVVVQPAFRFGDWALRIAGIFDFLRARLQILNPARFSIKAAFVCLAMAGIGFLYIGLPILWAEASLRLSKLSSERLLNIDKTKSHVVSETPEPSPSPMYPVLSSSGDLLNSEAFRFKDFRLIIPKINLESVVVKDVDPGNVTEYREQLKNGVAHALGSYLPGEDGTMFLFAHSTDTVFNITNYNAKFFAAKELMVGDEILVKYGDRTYKYIVTNKAVINPGDLDRVRNSGSDLVLSTCFPPGTDWQRLVVFAELVIDSGK